MDFRFLASRGIEKFFEDTDMSVGEIIRTIIQKKFTGIEVKNKSRLTDMSDQKWYEAIEKSFEYEQK